MCSETVLRNGFEVANKGASSYLASYVNCNSRSYRLATYKPFRQRCRRSNKIDYGCTKKDLQEIKQVIREGFYNYAVGDDKRPFVYIDTSRKDRFSVVTISQRVYYSLFQKCYGYYNLSSHAFCLRARNIRFFVTKLKGRLSDLPFAPFLDNYFHSQDFSFWRSYLRFLHLMEFEDSEGVFEYYLFLHIRLSALYCSQLNRNYMLTYETKTSHDYFFDAYNTESRIPGNSDNFWKHNIKAYDVNLKVPFSVQTVHELRDYHFQYNKRLLPKHRNSLFNENF